MDEKPCSLYVMRQQGSATKTCVLFLLALPLKVLGHALYYTSLFLNSVNKILMSKFFTNMIYYFQWQRWNSTEFANVTLDNVKNLWQYILQFTVGKPTFLHNGAIHWLTSGFNHFYDHKWAATWQNQQSDCAPSEDSDQPRHPPSLIRVFAVCSMGSWGPKLSSCGQPRLWDAQAAPSLRWTHMPFCWFCLEVAQIMF